MRAYPFSSFMIRKTNVGKELLPLLWRKLRSHSARRALWLVLVFLCSASGVSSSGQTSVGGYSPSTSPLDLHGDYSVSVVDGDKGAASNQQHLKALNAARQKALVSDSKKLLNLAEELNKEVRAADFDTLTPAQLRKLANIGKLAHSIKQNMSQSPAGDPGLRNPAT